MKTFSILFLLASAGFFASCHDEAQIEVTHRVHNVRLDQISFSKVRIGSELLPGESVETTLSDRYEDISFPVTAPLEFYMVKGDKRVYLKTKKLFRVDAGEKLQIVLEDATELVDGMK
jgi:hypothetical protein